MIVRGVNAMVRLMGLIYIVPGIIYFTYFVIRLLKSFHLYKKDKGMFACVLIAVSLLSLPATNFLRLYGTIYFHLLVICLVLEVLNLFLKRFKIYSKLLVCGVLPIIVLCVLFAYGFYNMNHIVKTEYSIQSDKVDGLVIVQITDMHMSTTMDVNKLKDVCSEISSNHPDVVVLTGDIFDESTPLNDMEDACYELSQISNTMGIYFVFGNHDSASYSQDSQFDEEDVRKNLEKNGIIVLDDEVMEVDNITLIGRKDAHFAGDNDRLNPKQLFDSINQDSFIIVLDHQPLDLEINEKLGADLQFSGHTHGGQMFPMRQMESLYSNRLVYGLREINDFTAITSSGIAGWGYPIKTGAPSEYVIVNVN